MSDDAIRNMCDRLESPAAAAAWREFQERYSSLIMQVARRYAFDAGGVTDLYVHVCDRLSDDGFRRLRQFRNDGRASFSTWLVAVTANLCIDWRRQQQGRLRPLASMAGLSRLDHLVYRNLYVRGMTREQCLTTLRGRFPDLDDDQLAGINARLFGLLSSRQRWQIGARASPVLSLEQGHGTDSEASGLEIAATGPGPEELAQDDQVRAQLHAALAGLAPQQRLLLRMRYEQDLTLDQIARLTGLADPAAAHRQIQAAVRKLRQLLGEPREGKAAKKTTRGPCDGETGGAGSPVGNA